MDAAMTFEHVGDDRIEEVGALTRQAFRLSREVWEAFVGRVGHGVLRCVRDQGRVVGALAVLPFRQSWGRRWVPLAGIGGVCVAPDRRGTGVASLLLRRALTEARASGFALSALYPATQGPYRKIGYEQAGAHHVRRIDLQRVDTEDRRLDVHPVSTEDPTPFASVYARVHPVPDGWTDRPPHAWMRLLRPRGAVTFAYLIGAADDPEGFLIFRQEEGRPSSPGPWSGSLVVSDFLALSPAALRRGWTLLKDHRSMMGHVLLPGGAVDARLLPLSEQVETIQQATHWMIRVLDVRGALEARGDSAPGEMDFHLDDPLFPENTGAWRFSVDGEGSRVGRVAGADLRVGPRGMSALFAGLYSPWEIARQGLLDGPIPDAADTLFPLRTAFLPDWF